MLPHLEGHPGLSIQLHPGTMHCPLHSSTQPGIMFIMLHLCAPCRHLAHTYGAGWADPNSSSDAVTQKTPDWWHIQQALLSRLSVTTWGDTPWSERINRCAALQAPRTPAGAVELGSSLRNNAAGQLQGAQAVQQLAGQLRQQVLQEAVTSGDEQQQWQQQQQHSAEVQETLTGQQRPDAEQQEQQQEHWQLLQQLKGQDDDDFEDDNAAGEGRGQHQQELFQDDVERDQWEDRQQQQQHQHKRSLLRQML